MRHPNIEKHMKELSSIYNLYLKTKGEMKGIWCNKWYELVKKIAAEIRQLRQD